MTSEDALRRILALVDSNAHLKLCSVCQHMAASIHAAAATAMVRPAEVGLGAPSDPPKVSDSAPNS